MRSEITITMTLAETELLRELIDLTANMGTFRAGDHLKRRDEDLLQKIYDRGHDLQKRMNVVHPT